MIDMMQFICPSNGRKYRLFGLGDEHMQCVQSADGWISQLKNELAEEFQVTATTIRRGADTSSLWTPDGQYHGNFYIQYRRLSNGAYAYGCDWSPRLMNVGDVFQRQTRIILYDWQGNTLKTYDEASTLKLERYHAAYTFPQSGITVRDVYELSWGGEEVYLYALDHGLVGWRNVRTGQGSFIGAYDGVVIRPPHPHPISRPTVPLPPPVEKEPIPMPTPYIPPPDTGARGVLAKIPGSFVNLREQPYTDAKDLGDLRVKQRVLYGTSPQAPGWAFMVRESDSLGGWVSLQNGTVEFIPELLPTPEPAPTPDLPRWTKEQLAALKGASGVLLQLLAEVEGEGEPTNSGATF